MPLNLLDKIKECLQWVMSQIGWFKNISGLGIYIAVVNVINIGATGDTVGHSLGW